MEVSQGHFEPACRAKQAVRGYVTRYADRSKPPENTTYAEEATTYCCPQQHKNRLTPHPLLVVRVGR